MAFDCEPWDFHFPTFGIRRNKSSDPGVRDWHSQSKPEEPACAVDQWRTRDRSVVMYFEEMELRHLRHCVRFARTKPQHRSRLKGLLKELERRGEQAQPLRDGREAAALRERGEDQAARRQLPSRVRRRSRRHPLHVELLRRSGLVPSETRSGRSRVTPALEAEFILSSVTRAQR